MFWRVFSKNLADIQFNDGRFTLANHAPPQNWFHSILEATPFALRHTIWYQKGSAPPP